ncbi:hypothetical protein OF83DRAFT_383921 [Amylostereum chailletii]|nr:hypothetical protein OF83DRAFT_383921 [Amylostereum chailletii]
MKSVDSLAARLKEAEVEGPLCPGDNVVEVFPHPAQNCVHFDVRFPSGQRVPLTRIEKAHLQTLRGTEGIGAPSTMPGSTIKYYEEQNRHPVYNGHPANRSAPIAIYHPVLAKLMHDLDNLPNIERPLHTIELASRLVCAAGMPYADEQARMAGIAEHLENLLDIEVTDGTSIEDGAVIFHALGPGSPYAQASSMYARHAVTQNQGIRNASCLPCILIVVSGTHIRILGAIFIDILVVQPLTGYTPLIGNPFVDRTISHVARVLHATKEAVISLRGEYRSLFKAARYSVTKASFPLPLFH